MSKNIQGSPNHSEKRNEFDPWGWFNFASFNRLHQAAAWFSFSNFLSSLVSALNIWTKSTKGRWHGRYINVDDGYWLRNILATTLRCWWRFWPFLSATSSIFNYKLRVSKDVIKLVTPTSTCHQHLCGRHDAFSMLTIQIVVDELFDQICLWKINDQIKLFSFSYIFSKGSFNKRIMK